MSKLSELLWLNNTFAGKVIILLIVGLGFAGGLSALRHRRRYLNTETHWLETVRDRLRRAREAQQPAADDAQTTGSPAPAMTMTVELRELAEGIPESSLIGDRLATIAKMKQARAKVNVDALQQSTILKESAQWTLSFPAYVVSLVMMLGLLGTFVGLSMMVVDIQQALPGGAAEANEWRASVSGLGQILAGKKTAFSATLAGLFFSIIVSFVNFMLARAQSELYDRLERFTTEELLPATMPAFDDETPWEKLSMQLGDSFEHLQALTGEQTRTAEQIVAVEKTFGTIIANIEAITHRAATAPLQGMTGEITNVLGQLTQANGAMVGLTEKLPQLVNTFRQTHQSTLSTINGAMQAQQEAMERLTRAVESKSSLFGQSRVFAAGVAVALLIAILLQRVG